MDMLLAPIVIASGLLLVFASTVYKASKFDFECTVCKKKIKTNPVSATLAPQSKGYKHLYCTNCRQKQFAKLIYKGK